MTYTLDKSEKEYSLNLRTNVQGHMGGFNDFDWYPWMNSSSTPGSELFITSAKDLPIQLWNSKDGKLICSWTAKDHLDQVANCLSVSFSANGQRIISGGLNKLWLFDSSRPGNSCLNEFSTTPKKRSKNGQSGLISCLNFRFDDTEVFAAGSFKSSIGIYDCREGLSSCGLVSCAHRNGVSQIKFLNDGWSFISSGRRDNHLKKWDLRMLSDNSLSKISPVCEFIKHESSCTNQRIYFDIISSELFSGSANKLEKFNVLTGDISDTTLCFGDIVSSVTCNSKFVDLFAISTGSRNFDRFDSDSDSNENNARRNCENKILLVKNKIHD